MKLEYLKNKKIIVTGGSGFFGSHVVERLKELGVKDDNIFVPRSSEYDLVHLENIKKMYNNFKSDVVVHMAGVVGGIGANLYNPGKFFYDNLMMGVQLLDEARKLKIKKFVTVGTVCAYPKFTPVPFKEEDLWHGYPEETNAPYGLAKKMLLVQSQSYRQEYGFNGIHVLPVNLYGPKDNFNLQTSHVIPALIRKCIEANEMNEEKIVLWGDGSPSREFLYVEDAAEAVIRVAEYYNKSEPVNLGSGQEITIKELIGKIAKLTKFNGKIEWDTSKPNGQPRRCLDTSKAKKEFGFVAKTDLDEGLRKTIQWYKKERKKGNL